MRGGQLRPPPKSLLIISGQDTLPRGLSHEPRACALQFVDKPSEAVASGENIGGGPQRGFTDRPELEGRDGRLGFDLFKTLEIPFLHYVVLLVIDHASEACRD